KTPQRSWTRRPLALKNSPPSPHSASTPPAGRFRSRPETPCGRCSRIFADFSCTLLSDGAATFRRAALYDAFRSGKLCDSRRLEGTKSRNRGRHGEHALGRTLLLLDRLHKHLDSLP